MSEWWWQRRVLVTGATGIVGSWLCAELVAQGASVTALVLDDDPQSWFYLSGTSPSCSIVRGDLSRIEDCMRAINLPEAEVVFHLGAQTIVGAALRDPLACFEANIRGTYNVLEAVRRLSPLVTSCVVASSDKAYGSSDVLPYTETMPLQGSHPYDVSKSCADLLATTYHRTYGLPVTIARCGNIYGGGDLNWSRIVPGTIRSLLRGERPVLRSDGLPVRDYIYVADVVAAYLALGEQTARDDVRGEAFNFAPQQPVTVNAMVATIAEVMECPADPIVLANATHEIPAQVLDASKAHRLLQWSPTWTLAAGLRETVGWYREYLTADA
jgi:CDP-glucose 4,6-dehydratase